MNNASNPIKFLNCNLFWQSKPIVFEVNEFKYNFVKNDVTAEGCMYAVYIFVLNAKSVYNVLDIFMY